MTQRPQFVLRLRVDRGGHLERAEPPTVVRDTLDSGSRRVDVFTFDFNQQNRFSVGRHAGWTVGRGHIEKSPVEQLACGRSSLACADGAVCGMLERRE